MIPAQRKRAWAWASGVSWNVVVVVMAARMVVEEVGARFVGESDGWWAKSAMFCYAMLRREAMQLKAAHPEYR